MRKIGTTALLAWTLWWTQEMPNIHLITDRRPMSTHPTQEACQAAADAARTRQAHLYKQQVEDFAWIRGSWPDYTRLDGGWPSTMQLDQSYSCEQAPEPAPAPAPAKPSS